jgi:predicted pyridoxine 5'-phosphate oxidase superfamily flavin-nucleotide-binding protein
MGQEGVVSELYDQAHRSFQDQHDSRRLADRLESMAHSEFAPTDREFIERSVMFFLATVDARGRPTVSYKGGAPGFVRVIAPSELVFPVYDGNGMFLSLGNIAGRAHIGMLFIDFQSPRRLRVQGIARIIPTDDLAPHFPGAQHMVRVRAEQIFVNCGRYIHKVDTQTLSPHVPDAAGHQPFPAWKRIDMIADSLCESDRERVTQAGGRIPIETYPGEDDVAASAAGVTREDLK